MLGDVKNAILLFPGPVVTYREFRQYAPRFVRGSTKKEYSDAIEEFKPQLGSVIAVRVARTTQPTKAFVKQNPNVFSTWPYAHLCQANDYATKFGLPMLKSISRNIKDILLRQRAISQEQYDA
jgi:hypothetical protein